MFIKFFKNYQENICFGLKRVWYRSSVNFEEISKTSTLRNVCKRILAWNEAMKKCFHINIFTDKHRWGCCLKYSYRYEVLEFYLRGTQSQILWCKICKVLQSLSFTEHYRLLGNYFRFPAKFLRRFFFLVLSEISILRISRKILDKIYAQQCEKKLSGSKSYLCRFKVQCLDVPMKIIK